MNPRNKIILFLILTFGLSLFSYVPILAAGTLQTQGGLFVLTLMWSPGIAALITQFVSQRSLRGLGWRPGPARWLGLAYILPVLYALPVYLFVWGSGLGGFPNPGVLEELAAQFPSLAHSPAQMIAVMVLVDASLGFLISVLSALGEEIGWRGLLVPELFKAGGGDSRAFTRAALISGAVWAAWHLPGVFFADYNSGGVPTWFSALCFVAMVIAVSFPFAWLTLRSGSLWPAVFLHASHNLFIQSIFDVLTADTGLTGYVIGEFGAGLVISLAVFAYLFWRQRSRLEQVQD